MVSQKKTILMPVYDGTITKNLLRTRFLQLLIANGNVRIVIIPPSGKSELYKKEFEVPGEVEVESDRYWKHDSVEYAFAYLYKHSIPTNFMKIRQVDWYIHKRQYVRYACASTLRFMGRLHWWRRILRKLNYLEPIPREVRELYERWSPDVVFAPTMIPRLENALMKLARADGKTVVGMAKSFDNLTSKAYLRMHPDLLIVPNTTGVDEAALLYDFPRERVRVTGICQYDDYVRPEIFEERGEFFKKLGLDPNKKTILYAPAGDWMNPNDKEILALVLEWIEDGTLPNTQVLLRLHPAYESRTEEFAGNPNIVVERPGQHYGSFKSYEFVNADVQHLASSLKYADVLVCTASTLMVESAIFDTPIVALGFDADNAQDYWHSVRRYYDREHCVPIVRADGMKIVYSSTDFLNATQEYLAHPEHEYEGRKRIVTAICYKVDGHACERTARAVLRALHIDNADQSGTFRSRF